jgi:SAM-dependent methyltransferase
MTSTAWKVWNRDDKVEQRTYKRVTGELPEMECTKQLVTLVGEVYRPGMTVLDVGCAAGHYYNGLRRLDPDIRYSGVDATAAYIDFAKSHFATNPNVQFQVGDIFGLPQEFTGRFDIVFCCNVMLHLPSHDAPLRNLVRAAKSHVFVRTLLAEKTHLSKLLYTDSFGPDGEPSDFAFQNTWSFDSFRKTVASAGGHRIDFLDDRFDAEQINREHADFNRLQSAVTKVQDGVQIAGSKVFEWKWAHVTK